MGKKPSKASGNGAEKQEAPPLNSSARAAIMKEVALELDTIDAQRTALNELAGEQRSRCKENGISVAELNIARLWRKQQREDEGKVTTFFANLREAMTALAVGEQGSLFMADDGGSEPVGGAGDDLGDDPRPRHLRTEAEGGTKL